MGFTRGLMLIVATSALTGCERLGNGDDVTDGGIDTGFLHDGAANVWVDPDGCQHWYIDDGLEGFMTPRLRRDGTPVCNDARGMITMKDGTRIATEQEPVSPGA